MARKACIQLLRELEIKAKELELRMLKQPVSHEAQVQMDSVIDAIRALNKLVPEDWGQTKS